MTDEADKLAWYDDTIRKHADRLLSAGLTTGSGRAVVHLTAWRQAGCCSTTYLYDGPPSGLCAWLLDAAEALCARAESATTNTTPNNEVTP
jgi:hypothetical protein